MSVRGQNAIDDLKIQNSTVNNTHRNLISSNEKNTFLIRLQQKQDNIDEGDDKILMDDAIEISNKNITSQKINNQMSSPTQTNNNINQSLMIKSIINKFNNQIQSDEDEEEEEIQNKIQKNQDETDLRQDIFADKSQSLKNQNKLSAINVCKTFISQLKLFNPVKNITQTNNFTLQLIQDLAFSKKLKNGYKQSLKVKQKNNLNQLMKDPEQQNRTRQYSTASNFSNHQKKSKITGKKKSYFQMLKHSIKHIPVIDPDSGYLRIWEAIHAVMIIVSIFYLIIDMVISDTSFKAMNPLYWQILITVIMFFFMMDMILQLNTGIIIKGLMVKDRDLIIKKYLKERFIYDLLAFLPMFTEFSNIKHIFTKGINTLILLKSKIMLTAIEKISDRYMNNKQLSNVIKLLQLLTLIFAIGHLLACMFWGLSTFEKLYLHMDTYWVKEYDLEGEIWYIIYLKSVYFAFTTMTTVGYGDITPQTNLETMFVVCAMVCTNVLFAYIFNSIGNIIQDLNSEYQDFKLEMGKVTRFLSKKNVNQKLKVETKNYLAYLFKAQNTLSYEEEEDINRKLSLSLREKIDIDSNMQILRKRQDLFGKFSQNTLEQIALTVKEKTINEFEYIEPIDEIDNFCLYYIVQGEIDILYNNPSESKKQRVIQNLKEKQFLGESELFSGKKSELQAKTKTICKVQYIDRKNMLYITQKCKEDQEWFYYLQESFANQSFQQLYYYTLDPNLSRFSSKKSQKQHKKQELTNSQDPRIQKCLSCGVFGHNPKFCKYSHIIPDKEKVVLKHIYQENQIRQPKFVYQRDRSDNTWYDLITIQKTQANYMKLIEGDYYEFYSITEIDEDLTSKSSDYSEDSQDRIKSHSIDSNIEQDDYTQLNQIQQSKNNFGARMNSNNDNNLNDDNNEIIYNSDHTNFQNNTTSRRKSIKQGFQFNNSTGISQNIQTSAIANPQNFHQSNRRPSKKLSINGLNSRKKSNSNVSQQSQSQIQNNGGLMGNLIKQQFGIETYQSSSKQKRKSKQMQEFITKNIKGLNESTQLDNSSNWNTLNQGGQYRFCFVQGIKLIIKDEQQVEIWENPSILTNYKPQDNYNSQYLAYQANKVINISSAFGVYNLQNRQQGIKKRKGYEKQIISIFKKAQQEHRGKSGQQIRDIIGKILSKKPKIPSKTKQQQQNNNIDNQDQQLNKEEIMKLILTAMKAPMIRTRRYKLEKQQQKQIKEQKKKQQNQNNNQFQTSITNNSSEDIRKQLTPDARGKRSTSQFYKQ